MPARTSARKDDSPEIQLDAFLDKYTPAIATLARACLAKMRARLPGAVQLVYDNYNALAIGFGPPSAPPKPFFPSRSTRDGSPYSSSRAQDCRTRGAS